MAPDNESERPEEFDETEWNPTDDPTDHPDFWSSDESSKEIMDRIIDGEVTDARSAIYSTLYGKVGERIEAMRPEVRSLMGLPSVEPPANDADTDETPENSVDDEE